jgi:hypothetical protein
MHLGQDRDQCWALVNRVMNLRVHKKRGFFFLDYEFCGCQFRFSDWRLAIVTEAFMAFVSHSTARKSTYVIPAPFQIRVNLVVIKSNCNFPVYYIRL